ncbi:hypothetical protein NE237_016919 [Protea cynaroides]|uniref:S-protein homolog n=1 Tax=Protea cynaroides TaxID=273540 RepID=A0A9Q0HFX1_9MAGN|nr:hypothetical protein NE237_016919 [Protea cynaroides]
MIRFSSSKLGMMVSFILILMWFCELSSIVGATNHVRITNQLSEGMDLTIHCKSKDNDLGVHQLAYNASFPWSFDDNALYNCHVEWLHGQTDFDAFDASGEQYRCSDCCWAARIDALYYVVCETGESNTWNKWTPRRTLSR